MAIFHLSAKVIGRSSGRSAVAAAAYRAAERLVDARTGLGHDYRSKTGVDHSEILLPPSAPERWADRAVLWNEVEAREGRDDAQLAREIEIALPIELSPDEARALVRDYVLDQFVARGMVADLNLHWTLSKQGEPQPHAHVMLTLRAVDGDGFGAKRRDWNDRALLRQWRQRWAEMTNERLCQLGHDVRIDHRSNAAQGLVLTPQHKIGPAGARRGARGEAAERAAEHVAIARANGERLLLEPERAIEALTAQHSTFTEVELSRFVFRHTADADQFARVRARVLASPELLRVGRDGRGWDRFSSRTMVATEQRLEAGATALARRTAHAVPLEIRQAAMARAGLSEEQALAVGEVTRARGVSVVVGFAGTGKSTMLGVAREAWEAAGYRVLGAALSGIAAEGLERGSGIASRTLHSRLYAWGEGRETLAAGDVLVVDEAGMIGSRQMAELVTRVAAAGARLVLVGDPEQLQAIEAGAAFRLVAERVGTVSLSAVRRQHRTWQREATRELGTGRTAAALERYAAAGMVREAADREQARTALVAEWDAERQRHPRDSRMMLAPTRAEVAALNGLARARLREAGELGEEQGVATERGERAMAAGDRVMFLRNERSLGSEGGLRPGVAVKNGTLGTVVAVRATGLDHRLWVRLDGDDERPGPEVTFSSGFYAALEHGYAATVHKAQGLTVERAHVLATGAMDRHTAYVALTRHREAVTLHYGRDEFADRTALAARLGRERLKDTTLDYPEADTAERSYAERRGLVPDSEIVVPPRPEELRRGREGFRAAYEGYRAEQALAAGAERWLRGWDAAWVSYRLGVLEMAQGDAAEPVAVRTALHEAVRGLCGSDAAGLRRHVAERAEAIGGADRDALAMVRAVLGADERVGSRELVLAGRLDGMEAEARDAWRRWQALRQQREQREPRWERERRPSPGPSPW